MAIHFCDLSGWILPDGAWLPVAEWWHINAIYELSTTHKAFAFSATLSAALATGDEAVIRHELALAGFAKVSRGILDTYSLSDAQLVTLQEQLLFFDSSEEILILREGGSEKRTTLERVLKLKRSHLLFVKDGVVAEIHPENHCDVATPPKIKESDLNVCSDRVNVQSVRRAKP